MNMNTLTLWQTIAGYRTRLVGLGFVVMICVGLSSPSYSQNQSADGSADKLHGDINPREFAGWFEAFKARATPSELHDFLWAMPKGGDLHLHITGSIFPEWWLELALASSKRGYAYFTRVSMNNCAMKGNRSAENGGMTTEPVTEPIYFETIDEPRFAQLSPCAQSEFKALEALDEQEKKAWLSSIRLDHEGEGRDEFFERHWQRLGDLTANPYIVAEGLARNALAFAEEGLHYFEPQVLAEGYRSPDGSPMPIEASTQILVDRMGEADVQSSGIRYRFQQSILRFLPDAEDRLARAFEIVAEEPMWVAVNMVGREDNDKGHPRRFLEPIRALRSVYPGVRLSIHGGEVDEPNEHVRDTLLLGATRVGHAFNLISDEPLLQSLRFGPFLMEINLISNLKLEYVDRFSDHPFPEYLRLGVPVALSTDDRGMWDTNMTDEFFVAVHHFNLSWPEVVQLSEASLSHSFLPEEEKAERLNAFRQALEQFMQRALSDGIVIEPTVYKKRRAFMCSRYEVCETKSSN